MSVAICSRSSSTVSFPLEKKEAVLGSILMPTSTPFGDRVAAAAKEAVMIKKNVDESPPAPPGDLVDIWTSIQARKAKQVDVDEPSYVHPLTRRSSSLMSQKSLETCTESLGSETGSDHYSSDEDDMDIKEQQQVILQQQNDQQEEEDVAGVKKEAAAVNYHCCSISSSSRRAAASRAFPPPLPSISCRDGPCVQMRPHRKDGRLVVEAVAVPSQNYLRAQRQGGRLLLSFIETTTTPNKNIINTTYNLTPPKQTQEQEQEQEQEEEEQVVDDAEMMEMEDQEEEEEDEVEVVDRGTVVEVKVQQQSGGGGGGGSAAMKVHRSSIVINKFVSCSSQDKENSINSSDAEHAMISSASGTRRSTACSTTTAAAAAVAASSLSTLPADGDEPGSFDNKLLFTSKRRNSREELLRDMRRCSQFRKPLFIWEPCCIAT